MCEQNVYMAGPEEGEERLVMEAVDEIMPEGPDLWRIKSIFGEQKIVDGRIRSMHLVNHRIIFEPPATAGS
ncbi:MAG: CooT family nickel-binding protein [Candidatus Adiutrix sp.]|jgi:predicted RNA-binding protein|nr:CooT family nickel-binding protein [Candidatus Adiutrix sp.]